MNKYALAIREAVTMREVAEHYGFEIYRGAFIKCPFHGGDKTPSLKIYDGTRGWHCYGCNNGGSVIDFVKAYHCCDFQSALRHLDSEFNLGILPSIGADYRAVKKQRDALMERMKAVEAEKREHERLKAEYESAVDKWVRLDLILINGTKGTAEWHDALSNIETAKYKMECAGWALNEYELKRIDGQTGQINRGNIRPKLV